MTDQTSLDPSSGSIRCAECTGEVARKRPSLFCSPLCKQKWFARNLRRGQLVAPFVQAAALARHAKSDVGRYATRQMWTLAAMWNAEDQKAGRIGALEYAKRRMEAGWEASDLDSWSPPTDDGLGGTRRTSAGRG